MKSCPHIIAVLQNSYPVEEYTVSENALAQMPIDIVNRYQGVTYVNVALCSVLEIFQKNNQLW